MLTSLDWEQDIGFSNMKLLKIFLWSFSFYLIWLLVYSFIMFIVCDNYLKRNKYETLATDLQKPGSMFRRFYKRIPAKYHNISFMGFHSTLAMIGFIIGILNIKYVTVCVIYSLSIF